MCHYDIGVGASRENLPSWAKDRPGWLFVGWIPREPIGITFEEGCAYYSRHSDHGEERKLDIYPEGAISWLREMEANNE